MVRTRTITAWAVMSRGWMRPPLATGHKQGTRPHLPLVVANGDGPGHLVIVCELERDCFRALKAGAVTAERAWLHHEHR